MIDAFFEAYKNRPSEKLAELFTITKKQEVVKRGKELILSYHDLATTVAGCGSIGYNHIARHFDSDVGHIWTAAKKGEMTPALLRKTHKQLTKESKRTSFHFFVSKDTEAWHLLFGDTTESNGVSRFVGGSHLHFINHLWGIDGDEILRRLPERPGGNPLHLRIEEANKPRHSNGA